MIIRRNSPKALEDGPFSTKELREREEGPSLGLAEEALAIVQYPPEHVFDIAASQYSTGKAGRNESRTWASCPLPLLS